MRQSLKLIMMMALLLFCVGSCGKQGEIQELTIEEAYEQGLKLISQGKYGDAAKYFKPAYEANYKNGVILYYFASAHEPNVSLSQSLYFVQKIPDSYNGSFSEAVLSGKKKFNEMAPPKAPPESKKTAKSPAASTSIREVAPWEYEMLSILKDIERGDLYMAELKLKSLEKECVEDPRCTAEEVRKINECINLLMKKQGRL